MDGSSGDAGDLETSMTLPLKPHEPPKQPMGCDEFGNGCGCADCEAEHAWRANPYGAPPGPAAASGVTVAEWETEWQAKASALTASLEAALKERDYWRGEHAKARNDLEAARRRHADTVAILGELERETYIRGVSERVRLHLEHEGATPSVPASPMERRR
jgi:hypothetical protein